VGRHAAGGGSPHPLVAAALAHRPSGSGARHLVPGGGGAESGLGWPGPSSPEGGGLGWPGDAAGEADDGAAAEDPAPSGLAA
jgi:hypothetical protein